MRTAVDERESRTGHEVAHGARDQHRPPLPAQATRADVYRQPRRTIGTHLDLSCVKPRSDVDAKCMCVVAHRGRAADRSAGRIEHGKETVARGVDLVPTETPEDAPHHGMVRVEQVAPSLVTDSRRDLGRTDYVGEQHGHYRAVRFDFRKRAGQELLDLVDEPIRVVQSR